MKPGEFHYDRMMKNIKSMQGQAIIAGIISMFGYVEGKNKSEAENLSRDYLRLINNIRAAVGNDQLPCIASRYEEKNQRDPHSGIPHV